MRDPCKLNDQDSMMSELRNDIWNNKLIEKWAKGRIWRGERERNTHKTMCLLHQVSKLVLQALTWL